jgi:hypothetical protein
LFPFYAAFVFNEPCKNKEDKWNKRVDDYENYIKEYIKHYKKALQGNSISLSKYPYMKAKWELIGMKLDKAKKKGTADQQANEKSITNSDENNA